MRDLISDLSPYVIVSAATILGLLGARKGRQVYLKRKT
jgi:hypothetical protein